MEHFYKEIPSGWFNYEFMYDMAIQKASKETNSLFVELGVWFGQSMCYAGVEIINSNKPIIVHGIDSFLNNPQPTADSHPDEIRYLKTLEHINDIKNVVKIIKSTTHDASSLYEDESIDFLYIDANHTYEDVKKDIEDWYPKVKKGGIIGGHDYIPYWEGLVKAVDEFFSEKTIKVDSASTSWYHLK